MINCRTLHVLKNNTNQVCYVWLSHYKIIKLSQGKFSLVRTMTMDIGSATEHPKENIKDKTREG